MTLKHYATGVWITSACVVSGVLWYTHTNPDISAEDVAACVAGAVERNYVQTWVTPPSNIVNATMRVYTGRESANLGRATVLLRQAITNSNVIYVDPQTWASNGFNMAWTINYTNDPVWYFRTNGSDRQVVSHTPRDHSLQGIALADRAEPEANGTNLLLYAGLSLTAHIPTVTNLLGGSNSWWESKGLGSNCYYIASLENSTGGVRYTVETQQFDDIRHLQTNMFRTVDFNPLLTGTVRRVDAAATNYLFITGPDPDGLYPVLYTNIVQTITTSVVSSINGQMAVELTDMQAWTPKTGGGFNYTAGAIQGYTNRQYTVRPVLPDEAFTNNRISRMRIYVAAVTRSPVNYLGYTNTTTVTYPQRYAGENSLQKYGWDIDFAGFPHDAMPYQVGGIVDIDTYLTTQQIWSLVADVNDPTNNAYLTIGPDDLVSNSYFTVTPPLELTREQSLETGRDYYRNGETVIGATALVIDWKHKLFEPDVYSPIETNAPAWAY